MKSWRRVLIGLLLILNALPFTLDLTTRGFASGFAFALFGLAVLFSNIPPLRDFHWLDALRTAAAAVCTAGIVTLRGRAVAIWLAGLYLALLLLLFLPWRLRTPRRRAADHAQETLDELTTVNLISDEERRAAEEALKERTKED